MSKKHRLESSNNKHLPQSIRGQTIAGQFVENGLSSAGGHQQQERLLSSRFLSVIRLSGFAADHIPSEWPWFPLFFFLYQAGILLILSPIVVSTATVTHFFHLNTTVAGAWFFLLARFYCLRKIVMQRGDTRCMMMCCSYRLTWVVAYDHRVYIHQFLFLLQVY